MGDSDILNSLGAYPGILIGGGVTSPRGWMGTAVDKLMAADSFTIPENVEPAREFKIFETMEIYLTTLLIDPTLKDCNIIVGNRELREWEKDGTTEEEYVAKQQKKRDELMRSMEESRATLLKQQLDQEAMMREAMRPQVLGDITPPDSGTDAFSYIANEHYKKESFFKRAAGWMTGK